MIPELFLDCGSHVSIPHPERGKEPDGVVDDLDPTEDGEPSEETHRSPNKAKLGLKSHLLVLFHLVIGRGVKEDLNEVNSIVFQRGWRMDNEWRTESVYIVYLGLDSLSQI